MKKIFCLFLLFGVVFSTYAQEPLQRRVFLWDVTLSMTGKAGCPNIWQPVKEKLIEEINLITDPNVEVVIIPFQHRALHEHMQTALANTDGKKELVHFIRNYELPRMWTGTAATGCEASDGNGKTTMTALYEPLNHCLEKVITPDKLNILVLLTDGKSDFQDDEKKFHNLIRNFCAETEDKNVITFYLMLTPQAVDQNAVTECGRLVPVKPDTDLPLNPQVLMPAPSLVVNTHDDYGKNITLKFKSGSSSVIKPGYKVRVQSNENPYLRVDAVCEVSSSDLSIEFTPEFKASPDQLRAMVNSGEVAEISLNFIPEESTKNSHPLVLVPNDAHTEIELIGAPEKTIKMRWE